MMAALKLKVGYANCRREFYSSRLCSDRRTEARVREWGSEGVIPTTRNEFSEFMIGRWVRIINTGVAREEMYRLASRGSRFNDLLPFGIES